MSNSEKDWEVKYLNDSYEKKIEKKIKLLSKSGETIIKKWKKFEADVTDNPYQNDTFKRIVKLRPGSGFPDAYRYRNDPLRVVYLPKGEEKVIYPLAVGTTTDIPYKKRH